MYRHGGQQVKDDLRLYPLRPAQVGDGYVSNQSLQFLFKVKARLLFVTK
jgi:hypothetical protein